MNGGLSINKSNSVALYGAFISAIATSSDDAGIHLSSVIFLIKQPLKVSDIAQWVTDILARFHSQKGRHENIVLSNCFCRGNNNLSSSGSWLTRMSRVFERA